MKTISKYEAPACETIALTSSNCILNGSIDSFETDPIDTWVSAPMDIPNFF